MNFSAKYPNAKTFEEHGDMILGDSEGPCWNCGEMTRWMEMNYQAYICSDECLEQKDDGFFAALNKIE